MDYLTTMLALSHGAAEWNIITNYFIDRNALLYFKLLGVGLVSIYLIHAAKRDFKSQLRVTRLLWWANFAYSFIAVSNIIVYFIQRNTFT